MRRSLIIEIPGPERQSLSANQAAEPHIAWQGLYVYQAAKPRTDRSINL
jgi:hypothetical protein